MNCLECLALSKELKKGLHEHCVMKNASFTPTECLLSCLYACAVFWHDATSFGRWETENTSTSLCQTPAASQGGALWWPSWQWQTDNGWMLHFTSLTFFWKCTCFLLRQTQKGQGGMRKITYNPPVTLHSKTHLLIWGHVTGKFTEWFSRTDAWSPLYWFTDLFIITRIYCCNKLPTDTLNENV